MTAPHDGPGSPAAREQPGPRVRWGYLLAAAALALAAWLLLWPSAPAPQPEVPQPHSGAGHGVGALASSPQVIATDPLRPAATAAPVALTRPDDNDLAAHVPPGQAPSMGEVIQRLNQAGVHTGLGAFNPPGTSPPLVGLAVPPDFALPDGFVRHHQSTDDGQDIEPILMFAPDRTFYDRQGRVIELPANRVVPPEWAPPGLPLRRVVIPPPLPPGKAGS